MESKFGSPGGYCPIFKCRPSIDWRKRGDFVWRGASYPAHGIMNLASRFQTRPFWVLSPRAAVIKKATTNQKKRPRMFNRGLDRLRSRVSSVLKLRHRLQLVFGGIIDCVVRIPIHVGAASCGRRRRVSGAGRGCHRASELRAVEPGALVVATVERTGSSTHFSLS